MLETSCVCFHRPSPIKNVLSFLAHQLCIDIHLKERGTGVSKKNEPFLFRVASFVSNNLFASVRRSKESETQTTTSLHSWSTCIPSSFPRTSTARNEGGISIDNSREGDGGSGKRVVEHLAHLLVQLPSSLQLEVSKRRTGRNVRCCSKRTGTKRYSRRTGRRGTRRGLVRDGTRCFRTPVVAS